MKPRHARKPTPPPVYDPAEAIVLDEATLDRLAVAIAKGLARRHHQEIQRRLAKLAAEQGD